MPPKDFMKNKGTLQHTLIRSDISADNGIQQKTISPAVNHERSDIQSGTENEYNEVSLNSATLTLSPDSITIIAYEPKCIHTYICCGRMI